MSVKSSATSVSNQNIEEVQIGAYRQISRLCLFFEAESKDDYQRILSFVSVAKGEIKEVEVVVYYFGKLPEPVPGNGSLFLVGKKDFKLFRQKGAALKEWLGTHEFDMLISFAKEDREKSKRLIKDIKAKIKVGPNFPEAEPYFDMVLGKPGEKLEFGIFYEQVKHYFSQLNININL
ncbi:MAG: hypothetical protein IH595_05380 [Bacteroidales bacterium]|nr:hypothetical protein [Bacteroidales bacterium]